jgi:hypothetical protein
MMSSEGRFALFANADLRFGIMLWRLRRAAGFPVYRKCGKAPQAEHGVRKWPS